MKLSLGLHQMNEQWPMESSRALKGHSQTENRYIPGHAVWGEKQRSVNVIVIGWLVEMANSLLKVYTVWNLLATEHLHWF